MSALDALTGGAFTAATASERAARVRAWLASDPPVEQLSEVFKELSHRDKGAARPLREKLDELRKQRGLEALAAEWASRARQLLDLPRLPVADALAWQRDAAKAGAPLSREPLAGLRQLLADRVKSLEDLQHRAQVQREAAVLLVQRIEVLSTKSWREAQSLRESLQTDVDHWREQAGGLMADASWPGVDPRFPAQIEAARTQLLGVWQAFEAALAQAAAAADDAQAALPAVPVWAEELRAARQAAGGVPADRPGRPKVDPAVLARQRAEAAALVGQALQALNQELAEGHGKAAPKAAADLRQALKDHGRPIDAALEAQVHSALNAAGELEGWQRWRADQIREELLVKAQALVSEPLSGRKQQETLRQLREQWKASDQGGVPNHGLWRKFDEACNQAYKVVEEWLKQVREQQEVHKAQRQALMDELRAWTQAHQSDEDWKQQLRSLHGFEQRWREGGHLSEKLFAQWQAQWKALIQAAEAPLQAARQHSLNLRRALIEEAQQLSAQEPLRIDAVRALQQRWQQESQRVPLERRQEQKLWDAFRKPIDEAFARKSAEREKAAQAMGEFDRQVLAAAQQLEQANAGGDAAKIQAAMRDLEAALRAPAHAGAAAAGPVASSASSPGAPEPGAESAGQAQETAARTEETPAQLAEGQAPAAPVAPRRVIAVRGDDRPGARKVEPAAALRPRPGSPRERGAGRPERAARPADAPRADGRAFDRNRPDDRGPRLGAAAFRAQREALEHAQLALRKLAAQAHGEVLTQIMEAWQARDAAQLPSAQALGKAVPAPMRQRWSQALSAQAAGSADDQARALLRLEIAAELPTPAEHLADRRLLQLQLLTQRHAAGPAQTWAEDVAQVLCGPHEPLQARRLQGVLKALLRK